MFTSEEPTRFGIGCLGSRALAGSMSAEALAALRTPKAGRLDQIRREAGFQGELVQVRLAAGYFAAFVELHIEQGPLLEQAGVPIGIVHGDRRAGGVARHVRGRRRTRGDRADERTHATLCAPRRRRSWRSRRAPGQRRVPTRVATTGVCRVHPGAINSIPDRVTLEIDIRDIDLAGVMRCSKPSIRAAVDAIAATGR